jgi:hypothetical protein
MWSRDGNTYTEVEAMVMAGLLKPTKRMSGQCEAA